MKLFCVKEELIKNVRYSYPNDNPKYTFTK